jgi:biotin carboxylase
MHRTTANGTVLFVGRRRRVFEAAHALGLDVVCVASAPPGRRTPALVRFLQRDLGQIAGDLESTAAQASADRPIAAVFALTEEAVLPAARIRRHLGLAGDSPAAAERATDKLVMKRAVSAAGIPCARFASAGDGLEPRDLIKRLGLPLVLKDRVGSGGRHARLVVRRHELTKPLAAGRLAESFVDGVEMSVESLVRDGRPVFVNATEYFRVRWANIVPASLPPSTLRQVLDLNQRAIAAIGVGHGITHMELFLTPRGPVFSELAARPPGGYVMDLIELAYGFDPWREWLRLGLGRGREDGAPEPPAAARAATRAAGVWLFHPGAGRVARVDGVEAARAVPGVERLRVRVEAGMEVAERIGSGQEAGHVMVKGRDRDEVAERLERAWGMVKIEMAGRG